MLLMPNNIRERRAKKKEWTQLRVAQAVGISASYLSLIENEHVEPSPALRADLARVLETTEAALFPEPAAVASSASESEATR
jgi:transcriptional regulator with XRE-family HTH domain